MIDQSLGFIGLHYKVAPVAIREGLTPLPKHKQNFFAEAKESLDGLVVLSTCNRVEFYGHARSNCSATDQLHSLLNQSFDISIAEGYFQKKQAQKVPQHLMRVACGIDSMVLGESQILGQVQESLRYSESASLISPELRTIFKAAVKAGKRARKDTDLGKYSVSIASAAIERIFAELGSLQDLHVIVIGTGKMGQLSGKILQKKATAQLTFVNRNHQRAQAMAVDACAQAVPIEELREVISDADVVISATDAPHIILGPEHIVSRNQRPLLLVDLAVPRDIDPFLAELTDVKLLSIDDLSHDIAQSRAARQAEVPSVETIIENELDVLNQRLQMLSSEPLITALRQKAEGIRQTEFERILEELGPLHPDMIQKLETFSYSLVKKLLHEPTLHLRHGDHTITPQHIEHLFGLSETTSTN